ncbi:hypothetical protein BLOT_004264 [Blomia tropicalis]|nr:hypothetical protein BLOT_004264 [Blomia tropicalis]
MPTKAKFGYCFLSNYWFETCLNLFVPIHLPSNLLGNSCSSMKINRLMCLLMAIIIADCFEYNLATKMLPEQWQPNERTKLQSEEASYDNMPLRLSLEPLTRELLISSNGNFQTIHDSFDTDNDQLPNPTGGDVKRELTNTLLHRERRLNWNRWLEWFKPVDRGAVGFMPVRGRKSTFIPARGKKSGHLPNNRQNQITDLNDDEANSNYYLMAIILKPIE